MKTGRALRSPMLSTGQKSSNKISLKQSSKQQKVFWLELAGLAVKTERFVPIHFTGQQGQALAAGLSMSARRRCGYSTVLARSIENDLSIGVVIGNGKGIRNALVVTPATVPNFVPRASVLVRKSNERFC